MATRCAWVVHCGESTGSRTEGRRETIYASSPAEVRRLMRQSNLFVYSIKPYRKKPNWFEIRRQKPLKINLLRTISGRLDAGVPPEAALGEVLDMEANQNFRDILEPAKQVLRSGRDMVTALEVTGLFDSVTLSILRTGQRGGAMRETLVYALAQQSDRKRAAALMTGRLATIGWETISAVTTIVSNLFWLIPMVRNYFSSNAADGKLQPEFEHLLWRSEMQHWFLFITLMLLILFVIVVLLMHDLADHKKYKRFSDLIYKVPLLGNYLVKTATADAFAGFARMMRAEVHEPEAVAAMAMSVKVPQLKNFFESAQKRLEAGGRLGGAMRHPLIAKRELSEIRGHQGPKHLAQIFEGMVASRLIQSERIRENIFRAIAITMGFYIVAAIGSALQLASASGFGMDGLMETTLKGF